MSKASVFVISLCCLAFAGCVLKGPELRVRPPIEVKIDGDRDYRNGGDHERGGRFCPPGLAKQGRC